MKDFKDNYIQIADTELWRHLAGLCDKLDGGAQFLAAVEEVCAMGLDISRDIIRLFPTFTLHDGTHSRAVCEWMWVLLGDRAKELTAEEAALLLMSACCHDMGMSVSENQKKRLLQPSFHGWKKHFEENPGDAAEFEAERNHRPHSAQLCAPEPPSAGQGTPDDLCMAQDADIS